MAKDTDAGMVGIGAGAAINSVNDITTALIDDGAVISGKLTSPSAPAATTARRLMPRQALPAEAALTSRSRLTRRSRFRL